jgi:hypothetical protein
MGDFNKESGHLSFSRLATLGSTIVDCPITSLILAVYEVDGRQYVAFFLSSARQREDVSYKPGKPEAQGYYVFALPKAALASEKEIE